MLTGMDDLIKNLRNIVGPRHVMTGEVATRRYRYGWRGGSGPALAVVRPGSLYELWQVARLCVAAGKIIITQAANTGLTGGSTPDGDYDREVVIINTLRLDGIRLINNGTQTLCHAGATLYKLEDMLRPLGREPHSVIGSSCIGASVVGGVCNNSGGALIQRGPAYTECALFARLNADGKLELVNHLGINLGTTPEEILQRLDQRDYSADGHAPAGHASDPDYLQHVRDVHAPTPARFNADPRRLHEAAGCAGRLIVFAVRLDTFKARHQRACFYIGTNDPAQLMALRRDFLTHLPELPISAEYMHRDAYDIANIYGRDAFWIIYRLGTRFLPRFLAWKAWVDGMGARLGWPGFGDRLLQVLSRFLPRHLPPRLKDFRQRFEHYLLLEVDRQQTAAVRQWLDKNLDPATSAWFACTPDEGKRAQLHRFVTASAAVRYRLVAGPQAAGLVALDIALPRDAHDWLEKLPSHLEPALLAKLYYGHFFCHVFHQDYIIRAGHDPAEIKQQLLAVCDARGAAYPAEHNVGHVYQAAPALEAFYRQLDPCNAFNPGIGKTPRKAYWRS